MIDYEFNAALLEKLERIAASLETLIAISRGTAGYRDGTYKPNLLICPRCWSPRTLHVEKDIDTYTCGKCGCKTVLGVFEGEKNNQ